MKKCVVLVFLLSVWIHNDVKGQGFNEDNSKAITWSIFWNGSLNLESDVFNKNQWTFIGLGAYARRVYDSGIGVDVKLSYRNWKDFDRTMIPLFVGPSYTISSTGNTKLVFRAGAGPELIIGNDYSGFFGGFDVGPEVSFGIASGKAVVIGVALAQAMSFHPDSFEYLDVYAGIQF